MLGLGEKEGVDMEISFVLDWTSFWIGAVSTVIVAFLGLVILAGFQYRKQRRRRT
jgi:hypothetical protein